MADEDVLVACVTGIGQLVDSADECLLDLQRAIRRDDPERLGSRLLLSSCRVVQKTLVPLVLSCSDEPDMTLSALKLMALLTMPVDPKVANYEDHVRALQEYKASMLRNDLWATLVAFIAEPIEHLQSGGEGEERLTKDAQRVELVLTLIRHLLVVADGVSHAGVADPYAGYRRLHDTLVSIFSQEQVLELLLLVTQVAEEHKQWGIILLEIFYLIFRKENPEDLHAFSIDTTGGSGAATSANISGLAASLKRDDRKKQAARTDRHNKFSRPFVVKEMGATFVSHDLQSTASPARKKGAPARRTVISKHKVLAAPKDNLHRTPVSSSRTKAVLKEYASQFIDYGYTVLMGLISVMTKTRPDAVLQSDQMNRLWLIRFFTAYHLLCESDRCDADAGRVFDVSPVSCTLDQDTFTWALRELDELDKRDRNTVIVLEAVAEMVRALSTLIKRGDRGIGTRLLSKLLHDPDLLLNKVPDMIKAFTLRTQSMRRLEVLTDLAETVLDSVRMLAGTSVFVRRRRHKRGDELDAEEQAQIQKEKEQQEQQHKEQEAQLRPDADEVDEALLKYEAQVLNYCSHSAVGSYCVMLANIEVVSALAAGRLASLLARLTRDSYGAVAFFWTVSTLRAMEHVMALCESPGAVVLTDELKRLGAICAEISCSFFKAAAKDTTLFVRALGWRSRGCNMTLAARAIETENVNRSHEKPLPENEQSEEEPEPVAEDSSKSGAEVMAESPATAAASEGGERPAKRRRVLEDDDGDNDFDLSAVLQEQPEPKVITEATEDATLVPPDEGGASAELLDPPESATLQDPEEMLDFYS
eukprot:m51a1_g632 hypothetical protein (816) ;mRNA; r:150732-153787